MHMFFCFFNKFPEMTKRQNRSKTKKQSNEIQEKSNKNQLKMITTTCLKRQGS